MYWANFLHFYQPPTQKPYWVKRVTKESYAKICEGLKRNPAGKITLNINAVLTELLVENGFPGLVREFGALARRGQIEFTESAKYHPLLPKLPDREILRQIKLNTHTNRRYFGNAWKPRGFFPPEMGFSARIARIVKTLGYQWIIADELSYRGSTPNVDWSTVYTIRGLGDFALFFRDRSFSFKILSAQLGTAKMLIRELGGRTATNTHLVTAMDGETFGHHRPGLERVLFDLWKSRRLPTVTISELPGLFPKREAITPNSSTWALMDKDLERRVPFARWDDPGNAIHELQWRLTGLALRAIAKANPKRRGFRHARLLMDRALHSDQYWWASARPWWSLEMIEGGAKDLKDAVFSIPGIPTAKKREAENLYNRIIAFGFEWQRNGTVEALAREEDEEIRQRIDADRPFVSDADFRQMIATLEEQMREAAKAQEYERAAQFRDRIRELKEERRPTKQRTPREHSHQTDWGV